MAAAGATDAKHAIEMEQKLLLIISDDKSGGRHASDNPLPQVRKTNDPGYHDLRPH
jgi:hypothetical protein